MKKLLSLLLCLLLLALSLSSCTVRNVPVVMEFKGLRLDEDVYEYWLSCYRAQFAYSETPQTVARYAEIANLNIMKTLVAAGLFDCYGLQLDTAARDIINAAMAKLLENAGGTREAFNEQAAQYGIDYEGMRVAITLEQKAEALYHALYGQEGAISDAQYEAYYQSTYSRVKIIYISYVDFLTDEDGLRVWDEKTGTYLYEKKTGTALEEQEKKAAAVRAALALQKSEAEFDALVAQYTEDPAAKGYKNGYYFSSELDYRDYIPAIPEAAARLEVGKTVEVTSAYGVHFLYGLACDKNAYSDEVNADFFDGFTERVGRAMYEQQITEFLTEVTIYREVRDKTRYEDVEPNFDLYW